jgi:HEAT repeat protein
MLARTIASAILFSVVVAATGFATEIGYDPLDPRAGADEKNVDRYIAGLADEQQGYYAAIKLAELGPRVLPKVLAALGSDDPIVRRWSARTLTDMGTAKASAGRGAIIHALIREKDEKTLWYMVQAVGVLKPEPEEAVPVLLGMLQHPSEELRQMAAEAIGELGPAAGAAKPGLVKAIEATSNDGLQFVSMESLRQIGIDGADAEALARLKLTDGSEGGREIFDELVPGYPRLAVEFVKGNPNSHAA